MNKTPITVVGNLVEDPELRFTPSGAPVANFRIASTPRSFDRATNEWKDGDTMFLTCSVWRAQAENVAESLERGMRVIVEGWLKARTYETREGEKRTVFEVDVDEVGPSLFRATAKVTKRSSGAGGSSAGGNSGGGWGNSQGSSRDSNPWGDSGSNSRSSRASDDPWATSAPSSAPGDPWANQSDDPPF